MPFVANTPESLLARSDSKDPKSTCRGITSAGRPCRRPLGTRPPTGQFLDTAPEDDPADEGLYCWQHKEQASHSARSSPGPKGSGGHVAVPTIREERTSLDTLADRLGLVDVGEKHSAVRHGRKPVGVGKGAGHGLEQHGPQKPRPQPPKRKKTQQTSSLEFCFCFRIPLEQVDEEPAEKPKSKPMNQPYQQQPPPTYQPQRPSTSPYQTPYRPSRHHPPPLPSPSKSAKSATSITAQMKHLIPDSLDAATASALMAELARPLAESDEPGYIYMFWLVEDPSTTSSTTTPQRPPVEAARSLLAPPPPSHAQGRRASDTVSRYASQSARNRRVGRQSMLLKIGRAANVQRRMNQWQRQCGYDVEVLRYYPYTSSTPSPTPSPGRHRRGSESPPDSGVALMTPHAKRVERLVHIELTGMGLRAERETCEACGRDHREWFEVGATRGEVRRVDEVIRRWVKWDGREE